MSGSTAALEATREMASSTRATKPGARLLWDPRRGSLLIVALLSRVVRRQMFSEFLTVLLRV
jgi:hypothetical protein